MDAGDIINAARRVLALYAEAETLVPQLIADYGDLKKKLSSDDDAVVKSAIDAAHGASQSLTNQLNALADPVVEKVDAPTDAIDTKAAKK